MTGDWKIVRQIKADPVGSLCIVTAVVMALISKTTTDMLLWLILAKLCINDIPDNGGASP